MTREFGALPDELTRWYTAGDWLTTGAVQLPTVRIGSPGIALSETRWMRDLTESLAIGKWPATWLVLGTPSHAGAVVCDMAEPGRSPV